jgi:hypothetical protein
MATVLASFIAVLIDLFFPNTFEQGLLFEYCIRHCGFIFFGFVIFRQYPHSLRTKLILAFLSLARSYLQHWRSSRTGKHQTI